MKDSFFQALVKRQYEFIPQRNLNESFKGSKYYVQRLALLKCLPLHHGCVNTISWNENGTRLLSGSDDLHLIITNPFDYDVTCNYRTKHRSNIFSAKFFPFSNEKKIVSCGGDGLILYTDLEVSQDNIFNCHHGTTYEVVTVPYDTNVFFSCGEDCTVRFFDLRIKDKCIKNHKDCKENIVIKGTASITTISMNNFKSNEFAIGCCDSTARIYDRRMLLDNTKDVKPISVYCAPAATSRPYRITSVNYSPKGEELLVSYSSEYIYLFDLTKSNSKKILINDSEIEPSETNVAEASFPGPSEIPVRRLRLRGDWSDTGPNARPASNNTASNSNRFQVRPTLQNSLMLRMTEVLSRMLSDPFTRAVLRDGAEGAINDESVNSLEQESTETERLESEHESVPVIPVEENSTSVEPVEMMEEVLESETQDNVTDENLYWNNDNNDVQSEEVMEEMSQNSTTCIPSTTDSKFYNNMCTTGNSMNIDNSTVANNSQVNIDVEGNGSSAVERDSNSSIDPGPSTSSVNNKLIHIKEDIDELKNICDGLKEKHGRSPTLNIVYSNAGPMASTISMAMPNEEEVASVPSTNSEAEEPAVDANNESNYSVNESDEEMEEIQRVIEASLDEEAEINNDDTQNDILEVASNSSDVVENFQEDLTDKIYSKKQESDDRMKSCRTTKIKMKYTGHRNTRTMIKEACFWGDNFIVSGSDCGHVFIWDKHTAELTMLLEADNHVVNCVQPHPKLPLLATSGIDYSVKLWMPNEIDVCDFDIQKAKELMERNEVMIAETRDTITVPASFMIRMIACLTHIRTRGNRRDSGNTTE